MLRRIRWIATAAAAIMVVVVVVVTFAVKREQRNTSDSKAMVPAPLAVGDPVDASKQVIDVPLVDEAGKTTSLRAFKGKWVVFAPAMTLCHETCPMTTGVLMEFQEAVRKAGLSKHVVVAEITVDPWDESPAQMRAYQRMTGAKFKMFTGSVANLKQLWKSFGILFKRIPLEKPDPIDWFTHKPETTNIEHSDGLFVLDPAGRERIIVGGMPGTKGHKLEPALYKLLDSEGKHNLEDPETPWTAKELLEDIDWGLGREVPVSTIAPSSTPTPAATEEELSDSPRSLASLHTEANELLSGSVTALKARIAALKGYPIVVNAWASWCTACQAEFPYVSTAAAAYGSKVAFIGYDASDPAGKAKKWLASHRLSYPSYVGTSAALSELTPTEGGLPITIYIDRKGKISYVHFGEYESQVAIDNDVERHALGKRT